MISYQDLACQLSALSRQFVSDEKNIQGILGEIRSASQRVNSSFSMQETGRKIQQELSIAEGYVQTIKSLMLLDALCTINYRNSKGDEKE